MNSSLPFDTTRFNELPISIFICTPVLNADGSARDYRIVFGNEPFALQTGKKNFVGELVGEIVDSEKFFAAPFENLPAPYVGFVLIDISEREKFSARNHFLRSIRKMEGAIILLREKDYGKFEVVFVSKNFAKLMSCSVEDATKIFNERGVIAFTHPDDRLAVKRMLRRRVSEDSTKDLTIRQINSAGDVVWCNVSHTFIDDFDEHYVYCNFFDVTAAKVYAQRLQTTYMSIADNFYRADERTLSMFRANITRNKVEDVQGRDLFGTDSVIRPYSELINLR